MQEPDVFREFAAALRMTESAVRLNAEQRKLVEKTIHDHCLIRKWLLHATTCRSNHVHVLVTAPKGKIEIPREQFKAWCSRRLNQRAMKEGNVRNRWWSERGWDEYIDDENGLLQVAEYILEGKDFR
jgi:REP element-mobilizing transposase RayT